MKRQRKTKLSRTDWKRLCEDARKEVASLNCSLGRMNEALKREQARASAEPKPSSPVHGWQSEYRVIADHVIPICGPLDATSLVPWNINNPLIQVGDDTGATDSTAVFNAIPASLPNGGVVIVPYGKFACNLVFTPAWSNIQLVGMGSPVAGDSGLPDKPFMVAVQTVIWARMSSP